MRVVVIAWQQCIRRDGGPKDGSIDGVSCTHTPGCRGMRRERERERERERLDEKDNGRTTRND